MNKNKIRLKILGITFSQVQAGAYALVLAEEKGVRRVPIIIGTPEAQSIAIHLEELTPPRPLTHDLFISFLDVLHVELKEIFIYKYEDGIFYSELVLNDGEKEYRIDSRTSDAIAIAVRTQSPIYIEDDIMIEVSVVMAEEMLEETDQEELSENTVFDSYENMTMQELKTELNEAIENENYEKAALLQQLIDERKR